MLKLLLTFFDGAVMSRRMTTIFDAVNNFRDSSYTPQMSDPLDSALQFSGTILALPLALFFFVQGLENIVGVPVVTSTTIVNPGATKVAELFAQLQRSEISALSCPCSNARANLSDVSKWDAPEDPYCTTLREATIDFRAREQVGVNDSAPPAFTFTNLVDLLLDNSNPFCIATPELNAGPNSAWDNFRNQINTAFVEPGGLFGPIPELNRASALHNLAEGIQRGLCGSAFGTLAPSLFVNSPSGIGPTSLFSGCEFEATFQPTFSQFMASPQNFVQLQQTRTVNFLRNSVDTCTNLNSLREGFENAVGVIPLITYSALSPSELNQTVERLWFNTLGERARQAAGLTPGFDVNERTSFLTELAPGRIDQEAELFNNYFNIAPDAFPFSSRLPFARADFLSLGERFFYVTAASQSIPYVQLMGQSRLIATGDSTQNPYLQFLEPRLFGLI